MRFRFVDKKIMRFVIVFVCGYIHIQGMLPNKLTILSTLKKIFCQLIVIINVNAKIKHEENILFALDFAFFILQKYC